MLATRALGVCAALMLLTTACGAARNTASQSSPPTSRSPAGSASAPIQPTSTAGGSPTAGPSASAATSSDATFNLLASSQPSGFVSQITCSGPIGTSDPVAIVRLHSGGWVLRDYADQNRPRTACQFGGESPHVVQLIDARHIVVDGTRGAYAVVDLPSARYHWFQLPETGSALGPTFVAVAPGLDQVTWLEADLAGNTDKVHLTTTAGDRVVASLPNPHGGRCGSADDSTQGAYTHSGAHFFVLDQPGANFNSLTVVNGAGAVLSVLPPAAGWAQGRQPAMAVWSPTSEALFYRQGSDVWRWTAGSGLRRYLAGVSWSSPTITPDGSHLAYAVARSDGLHNVFLVDLAHGGSPRLIGRGARNRPVFLNSGQLWYMSEGQGICGPGGDKPFVYDIASGSEFPSIIDGVLASWPATSSNF